MHIPWKKSWFAAEIFFDAVVTTAKSPGHVKSDSFLSYFLDRIQSSLNKSTAQISVTAKSTIDLAEQFEFWPIRSSKVQINQPVAFKIQIVQLNLIY